MSYDIKNLNGWSISEEVFIWILENIPHGSTILELGSGNGTKELVKYYDVYTIEQNSKWLNNEPKAKYIYAPIKNYNQKLPHSNGWYDDSCLSALPKDYRLLIIDGPVGNDRGNFILFHNHFRKDIPYIIDDTNRNGDNNLANSLQNIMQAKSIVISSRDKQATILIEQNQ